MKNKKTKVMLTSLLTFALALSACSGWSTRIEDKTEDVSKNPFEQKQEKQNNPFASSLLDFNNESNEFKLHDNINFIKTGSGYQVVQTAENGTINILFPVSQNETTRLQTWTGVTIPNLNLTLNLQNIQDVNEKQWQSIKDYYWTVATEPYLVATIEGYNGVFTFIDIKALTENGGSCVHPETSQDVCNQFANIVETENQATDNQAKVKLTFKGIYKCDQYYCEERIESDSLIFVDRNGNKIRPNSPLNYSNNYWIAIVAEDFNKNEHIVFDIEWKEYVTWSWGEKGSNYFPSETGYDSEVWYQIPLERDPFTWRYYAWDLSDTITFYTEEEEYTLSLFSEKHRFKTNFLKNTAGISELSQAYSAQKKNTNTNTLGGLRTRSTEKVVSVKDGASTNLEQNLILGGLVENQGTIALDIDDDKKLSIGDWSIVFNGKSDKEIWSLHAIDKDMLENTNNSTKNPVALLWLDKQRGFYLRDINKNDDFEIKAAAIGTKDDKLFLEAVEAIEKIEEDPNEAYMSELDREELENNVSEKFTDYTVTFPDEPEKCQEASMLVVTKDLSGKTWYISGGDSGNTNELYIQDPESGKTNFLKLGEYNSDWEWIDLENMDWEALTVIEETDENIELFIYANKGKSKETTDPGEIKFRLIKETNWFSLDHEYIEKSQTANGETTTYYKTFNKSDRPYLIKDPLWIYDTPSPFGGLKKGDELSWKLHCEATVSTEDSFYYFAKLKNETGDKKDNMVMNNGNIYGWKRINMLWNLLDFVKEYLLIDYEIDQYIPDSKRDLSLTWARMPSDASYYKGKIYVLTQEEGSNAKIVIIANADERFNQMYVEKILEIPKNTVIKPEGLYVNANGFHIADEWHIDVGDEHNNGSNTFYVRFGFEELIQNEYRHPYK